ncbi:nucleoside triphosphate pyrophosphohydrolase family protein [Telmatospirillum sp. J64-1]|uniref:nucleoside triphosphate pyrophosphohydrolase family protein n=1 Tax=Telmatospirillum sp. J64-1 TaxID=2502183 RepID=UPI00115E638A|nr:nucleoside triphosphate pyrophosphohydrolase family protein [Telmatospirillum sp. J64-1]
MLMNNYQTGAMRTAIYPRTAAVVYPAMLLASEAGEVAGKVQKLIRKDRSLLDLTVAERHAIRDEVGDVLWACAALLSDLGYSMEDCAVENLTKLASRASRGVLDGDGDNR